MFCFSINCVLGKWRHFLILLKSVFIAIHRISEHDIYLFTHSGKTFTNTIFLTFLQKLQVLCSRFLQNHISMSVQYFYEISSPSSHMVPHSPFMRKPPAIVSSPVAIVPDVDNNRTFLTKDTKYIGIKTNFFVINNEIASRPGGVWVC